MAGKTKHHSKPLRKVDKYNPTWVVMKQLFSIFSVGYYNVMFNAYSIITYHSVIPWLIDVPHIFFSRFGWTQIIHTE
jgi:hypothetical protein